MKHRAAESLGLALPPRAKGTSALSWLCAALRAAILDGGLRPGARLPASRELARQCRVSRGTVVSAFEQLKSEGYISARTGSGTYVNTSLPDSLLEVPRLVRAPGRAAPLQPRRLSALAMRIRRFPQFNARRARAFRANQPALDLFPTTLWAQVAGRTLRRATAQQLRGSDPFGYEPLRKAVADYLYEARGVFCEPEQVAIVSGMQEALDLVARLLLNPGDAVGIENPGYVGAALAFQAAGARIVSVPLDDEGMTLPRARNVRLVYATPAHQFPVGVGMSLPRRLALIDWAHRTGALIFEDDYDSEYRYSGPPLRALHGLDRHGVVLFAGSFSKVLFPSLRLGYLIMPPDLVDRFTALKSVTTRFAPVLEQATLCEFLTEGHFGRHVRRMREVYAGRLGVLLESASETLAGRIDVSNVEAGLQTAGWLTPGLDAAAAAAIANARGIEVTPVSSYCLEPLDRQGLVLGFAAIDAREIRQGVRDLAAALEQYQR